MPLSKSEDALTPGMSTQSALVQLTPLECEKQFAEGSFGGVPNPSPRQSRSARMGGWCTATTSYGGPQDSTK